MHLDEVGVSAAVGFDLVGDVRDELLRLSKESPVRTASDRRLVRRLRRVVHLEGRILVFVTEVRFEAQCERDRGVALEEVREVLMVAYSTQFGVDERPEHYLELVDFWVVIPVGIVEFLEWDICVRHGIGHVDLVVEIVDNFVGGGESSLMGRVFWINWISRVETIIRVFSRLSGNVI